MTMKRQPKPLWRTAGACLGAFILLGWLDPYRDAVDDGNREYQAKRYSEAKTHYRAAERHAPAEKDKRKLSFNRGDADYMLEDFDNAATGFQDAIQSDDREVQKRAFFNLGNAYLKQGKNQEAVRAYMNALKIDPGYERAKKNLEYLVRRQQEQKQDQRQNQGDGKDDRKKSGADDRNDRQQKDQQKKNQDRQKQGGQDQRQKAGGADGRGSPGLNREQIEQILKSMKQSPVRREKGTNNGQRTLEKSW